MLCRLSGERGLTDGIYMMITSVAHATSVICVDVGSGVYVYI